MAAKAVRVNVSLSSPALKSISSTVAKLERAGLRDANVLEAIGVVTGRIAQGRLADLKKVPGVRVELDETVQIPPPDEPVQ